MKKVILIPVAAVLMVGRVGGGLIGCGGVVEEDPPSLADLGRDIRAGLYDDVVGKEGVDNWGMGTEQRFHLIHTGVLGLECQMCHQSELAPAEQIFSGRVSEAALPFGAVDKRICIGCHSPGGPARLLYGPGGLGGL